MAQPPIRAGTELLQDEEFIWNRVWPLVSGGAESPPHSTVATIIHRNRADGRAVAEYRFGDSTRVFAKLYPDDAAGRAVYRIHDELCRQGFGPGSMHRVPEPIAYLDEFGVVLLRPASGENLVEIEAKNRQAFEDGVAGAARWLAALHSSQVALGPAESIADSVFRLTRRATKATAACPELADVFRAALAELETRRGMVGDPQTPVQTHGRYHAGHVVVTDQSITAIDLDRAALADPAKDVGEFLYVLRAMANVRRRPAEVADDACELFLGEYARHRPAALPALSLYWSYSVLWALLRLAFKDRPLRRGWQERVQILRTEFDEVPHRAGALVTSSRRRG